MQRYRIALMVLWVAGCIGAAVYSQQKNIAIGLAVPVGLAFLVELSLYAGIGTIRYPSPWILAGTSLIPYLILVAPLGLFSWKAFGTLAGLALVMCWWLALLDKRWDMPFLVLAGGIYLAKILDSVYPEVGNGLKVDTLGQLAWFRMGVSSVLNYRSHSRLKVSFLPEPADWFSGAIWCVLFLPAALALNLAIHFTTFRLSTGWWWKGPGTFVAILWTVALAEEIFFRGLLLERLREWKGLFVGVVLSSLAFGFSHLWFRHQFPNYKQVAVSGLLGLFCAGAYWRGKGVRSAMVCHSLVVAVWRAAFT